MPVISQADVDTLAAIVARVKPDPIVIPPPVDPPPVVIPPGVRRVQTNTSANWIYADVNVGAKWLSPGGDWFDKTGVVNGPTPTIAYKVIAGTNTVDISGIDGDILVQGMAGYWGNPKIDGVAVVGFWTSSTSATAQPLPYHYGTPAFILNPKRGKVLTFDLQGTPSPDIGKTIRLDKVAGPQIVDPVMVKGWKTPDILDIDFTSREAIASHMAVNGDYQPGETRDALAFNEEYLTDPSGLHYLRCSTATPLATRLISWFIRIPPREEVWGGFAIYIEDDVADGMVELGMKLCGFGVDDTAGTISFIAEHDQVSMSPENRGLYGLQCYQYDVVRQQWMDNCNATLQSGRWYYIEMHCKMNTLGQADGLIEMRLNGNLVWQLPNKIIRNEARHLWSHFRGQIYHGGKTVPKAPFHYRIAHFYADSKGWCGVPDAVVATQLS